jgi:hypothetical protein
MSLYIIAQMMKSRRMRLEGKLESIREGINAYRVLVGRSEGKRQLRRPRHRWEGNYKLELGEIGWGHLVQNRHKWRALVNTVMNI